MPDKGQKQPSFQFLACSHSLIGLEHDAFTVEDTSSNLVGSTNVTVGLKLGRMEVVAPPLRLLIGEIMNSNFDHEANKIINEIEEIQDGDRKLMPYLIASMCSRLRSATLMDEHVRRKRVEESNNYEYYHPDDILAQRKFVYGE